MKYFFIALLALLPGALFSQAVPISSIKQNNSNGEPALNGQVRTVTGIVTAAGQFGGPGYIMDSTGGIAVFDSSFSNNVQIGDSVVVTGTITHFNGLIELANVTRTVVSSGHTVTPVTVTLAQIINQSCVLEEYEGRLVRINGVTISGSGQFQSNFNYRITDATGMDTLRIDNNTNLVGTNIPAAPFDLIAVVGQFDGSIPRCEGFQLQPRFLSDLILAGGPIISSNPVESDITPNGVTLTWLTQNPGDTKVKYFVSDSLDQPVIFTDSIVSASPVTTHTVTLTGLRPGRIYYALVSSENGNGISTAAKYFSTASHPSSTGRIETYFNFSVDTAVAFTGNKASGTVDLKERLIQRIDSARFSIDIAMYSFNDINQIRDRLIIALTRGVKIRIVYDSRSTQPLVQDLMNAGIPVQKRPFPQGNSYIMHNKFFIFDSRDTSSYSDDWLWTGSANVTSEQFYNDAENVLFINDQALANTYTREFEEMWGSHNEVNSPANGKFGADKADNTPHIFIINGRRIESYFSPSDNVSLKIENIIDSQTDKSINFCAFNFTRFAIANEMKAEYNPPNKMVRGVFDRENNLTSPVYLEMNGTGGSFPWNPAAKVFLENNSGLLHHKYILIDADAPQSNPIVQTGSYNYSDGGTFGNDENILIIYDSLLANQYYQEFAMRLTEAGGSIGIQQVSSNVPSEFKLKQNYPNPFNPETSIQFSIPVSGAVELKIYDMLGKETAVLVNGELKAGIYNYKFNAANLSSGVYFYTLKAGEFVKTMRMVLVK
jgi:phosphatidylserine/phosphatidylglycerophosphate/cardiolipin synthase-like enzyme